MYEKIEISNKLNVQDEFDSNEKLINQMEIEILSTSILQIMKKVKFKF